MKNILSHGNREVLEQFAWSKVLLGFDYDGTLAPIVIDPEGVSMRQRTRELLSDVTKMYPTVVISGRARPDAVKRLEGLGVSRVIGNHGIEASGGVSRAAERVREWVPILEGQLASFRGVFVEDKTFSLAIHYRQSREKKKARYAILRAVAALGEVRVIGGKQVVNVLPQGAPHKGVALETERDRLRCDTAIYVGDDDTDEDVFSLDQPGRLLTIRVGAKRASAASYFIPGQRTIDQLLGVLIDARRKTREREPACR